METKNCFILLSIFITSIFDIVSTCLFLVNKCVTHCPRNMHPYHTRCEGEAISQRTCAEPVQYNIGFTCGWSRCDCNGDLLLEESSATCVDFVTCTINVQDRRRRRARKPRKPKLGRVSKKLRLKDEDDIPDMA
ncbi:hypothetical protein evm_004727 [Chilo suppressalis]|nr:hypothetical protein evm_004727 [Chilo suppressalis]